MTEDRAVSLLIKSAAITAKSEEMSKLRKEFVELLPFATPSQFAVVKAAEALEEAVEEGYKVGLDFKLTDEQKAVLVNVRVERAAYLTANKKALVDVLVNDATQKLVSMKVRQGAKKVTTTCKFERDLTTQKEGRGLLAKLAKNMEAARQKKVDQIAELMGDHHAKQAALNEAMQDIEEDDEARGEV